MRAQCPQCWQTAGVRTREQHTRRSFATGSIPRAAVPTNGDGGDDFQQAPSKQDGQPAPRRWYSISVRGRERVRYSVPSTFAPSLPSLVHHGGGRHTNSSRAACHMANLTRGGWLADGHRIVRPLPHSQLARGCSKTCGGGSYGWRAAGAHTAQRWVRRRGMMTRMGM
jgi:hypothetical protein